MLFFLIQRKENIMINSDIWIQTRKLISEDFRTLMTLVILISVDSIADFHFKMHKTYFVISFTEKTHLKTSWMMTTTSLEEVCLERNLRINKRSQKENLDLEDLDLTIKMNLEALEILGALVI